MADADDGCPFLVPVTADRLWMYPTPAYCRRPEARVKAPAPETLSQVCSSPAHAFCPGFLASLDREGDPRR